MNNDNKKKEKHDKKNDKASKNNEKLVKNKKVEKQKSLPEETSIKKIQQKSASDVSKSLIDKSEASSINGIDNKKLKHIANKSENVSPLEKKRKKKSKHKPKISGDVPNEHLMSDVKTNVMNGDEEQSAFSVKFHKDSKKRNDQVPDMGSQSAPNREKVLENVEKKNKKSKKNKLNKHTSTLSDNPHKFRNDDNLSESVESIKTDSINNTFSVNDNWDEPLKDGETEIFVPNPKYSGNIKSLSPNSDLRTKKDKTPKKSKSNSDEVYGTPSIKTPSKPPTPVFIKKAISKSEGKDVKNNKGLVKSEPKKLANSSSKKSKLGM